MWRAVEADEIDEIAGAPRRSRPRRSWLTSCGALLLGGLALAPAWRASAAEQGGASGAPPRTVPATSTRHQAEPADEEGDDCASLAWSCETSDEVSKDSARCACGDADGACARQACRRAEEHPSAAVRREQALSRRRVEACQRGDKDQATSPRAAGGQRSARPSGK